MLFVTAAFWMCFLVLRVARYGIWLPSDYNQQLTKCFPDAFHWGRVSVCCLHPALGTVACQGLSLPLFRSHGAQKCKSLQPPGAQTASSVWTVSTRWLQQSLRGAEDWGAPASDSKVDGESKQKTVPTCASIPRERPSSPLCGLKNLEKEQNAKLARGRKS